MERRRYCGGPGRVLSVASFLGVLLCTVSAHAALVGWWTFEPGNELRDLTGNWGDLTLVNATVSGGALDVDALTGGQFSYARASGYTGPTITQKTLVSWVELQDLDDVPPKAGSALTIDRISSDVFDGLVYSENYPGRWQVGSNNGIHNSDPGPDGAGALRLQQVAATFSDAGNGNVRIRLYIDGTLVHDYVKASLSSWSAGDAEVFFGLRHSVLSLSDLRGQLDALIYEARIYDTALTQAEIQSLELSVTVPEPTLAGLAVLSLLAVVGASRARLAR